MKGKKDYKIVITFFSPSGYEIRKKYKLADLIIYLPKDSKSNASRFLNYIKPTKIFFIKYEFWANYLLEANKRNIQTYLVSGVFRENQIFFKWYGGFMRQVLKSFTGIYLQNNASKPLLDTIQIKSKITGDTRYDRVMQNSKSVKSFPEIELFLNGQKAIIIGSCWAEDEAVIFPTLNLLKDTKIIVAPHELSESHFTSIESSLKKTVLRYSQINNCKSAQKFDILLIDNIGMLMHLYQYASIAYIGGAFGKGLHNILEPASFGVPVIFGNNYAKFPEAFQFVNEGIGFSISNSTEFEEKCTHLLKSNYKEKVLGFMTTQTGATQKIIEDVF